MEQFSQNTFWTLAEDLKHLKGQERSPQNRVGWKERTLKFPKAKGFPLKKKREVSLQENIF